MSLLARHVLTFQQIDVLKCLWKFLFICYVTDEHRFTWCWQAGLQHMV